MQKKRPLESSVNSNYSPRLILDHHDSVANTQEITLFLKYPSPNILTKWLLQRVASKEFFASIQSKTTTPRVGRATPTGSNQDWQDHLTNTLEITLFLKYPSPHILTRWLLQRIASKEFFCLYSIKTHNSKSWEGHTLWK